MIADIEKINSLKGVKIARVSTVSFFVETQLKDQLAAIAEQGAELTVVASDQNLNVNVNGMRYIAIDIPREIHLFRDFVALWRLWRLFKNHKFDIVHSTTPKAGLLCSVAAFLARVPIRLHTFTGQPWVGLKGVKCWISKISDRLIVILNTYCYADSPSQKQFIVAHKIASDQNIGVLGDGSLAGINLQRFSPELFDCKARNALRRELNIPESVSVLLFVGRFTPDKGIVELLAAYEDLIQRGLSICLIALGPLEVDGERYLRKISMQARAGIRMPGFSRAPERYMAIADILVLPSYREGFGTVVLEAAAMKVPTVGSNIYGLSDAIQHDETGLLVPVRNIEMLSKALESLLRDPDRRLTMGIAAFQRACKYFSSSRINALVIAEYMHWLQKMKAKARL